MNLKDLSFADLTAALAPAGASRVETLKTFAAVFAHDAQSLADVRAAKQVTRKTADFIAAAGATLPRLSVVERRRAADGFVKYLFESPEGGRFEAVRIPIFEDKYIVCVSSQIGCAMACDFCETGRMGFSRNLATWEIVDQVMTIRREADRPVRGVVFMGMGEPLLNYERSIKAAQIMSHPAGLQIGGKAITFSTVGVVPAIRRYIDDDHSFRLAFSITSAIPAKRGVVLPVEKTHPLPTLVDLIREYTVRRRQRAMIAYVVIKGWNTGREDAEALRDVFAGIPIQIDLIEVTDPTGKYVPPDLDELDTFRSHLQILKSPIIRRYSGGKEIGAACGTLASTQAGGKVLGSLSGVTNIRLR